MLALSAHAQDNPLWMRYCAISPDGTSIAFTYKGDIYTVPVNGGKAAQITTNAAHDTHPVWSPDGKQIAFASDRMGSMDIFVVDREGGIPKRLTTHSGNETPVAFKDADHILFLANVMPSAEDAQFPSGQFQQVYEVSTTGDRPVMFSSMPMEDISINKTGNALLYHDKKGYEDPWRKHHTSSITRDIWLCSLDGKRSYRKLTSFNGEDRTPVWASDGKSFYYLSEEKGSFNVFKRALDGTSSTQLTHHTKHPVRFLTAADNGTLCYGYDGEIYTMKEGTEPRKVQISILTDKNDKDLIRQIRRNGATEIALSPDAKEVAFILRGDVYVTSVEYKTTKQITNTPEQERDINFAPDGRSIVYASERNGLWQIYQASLNKKEEKQFTYATDIKEEKLTGSAIASFQPQFSPDGKEIAFLEDRTTIRVLNLKSKNVRTVMDGKFEYSYSDGDQWYQWSPDSKWILTNYIGIGGWNNQDVALVNASGNGEIHNLTESGYTDTNAKWVLDGKAMMWYSDRAGYRSHGSWGAEADVYIMFFDLDAYERFRMNKEELAKHLSKNDGLDRGGEIRTAADEDGNVFVFSENKYGCPVIDVLVEGQGKETAYFKTGKGEITVYEETGRMLEETDPREAAISGRWYPETVPVQKEVPDVMTVQLMKGNDKLGSYYVGHDTTKSGRESLGQLIWKEDIGSYHSDSINVELLRKAIDAYNDPEGFARNVERIKQEREAARQKEVQDMAVMQEIMHSVRGGME